MTLYQLGKYFRAGVNILIGLVSLYIIILLISPSARSAITKIFPEEDPPLPAFGKLAPIEFIEFPVTNKEDIDYEINTVDGRLPGGFPDKMPVYTYNTTRFSFEAGKAAQEDASALGFTDADLVSDLKGDLFVWRDFRTGGTLTIELLTNILKRDTRLSNLEVYYIPGRLNEQRAIQMATQILNQVNRLEDEVYLERGTQTVRFGRYVNENNVVNAFSGQDAQLARVDFFRSIRDYPVLGPNPTEGLIYVVIGSTNNNDNKIIYPIMEAAVFEINFDGDATYPIISVNRAWEEVLKGNGVISNITATTQSAFQPYVPVSLDKFLLDEVYLAYFDNPNGQEHMQPIYVFEGNFTGALGLRGNMTIYYPAIDGTYIQPIETPQEIEAQNTQ